MRLTTLLIIFLCGGPLRTALAHGPEAGNGELERVKITRCSSDGKRCLKAKAERAETSVATNVMGLRNIEVRVTPSMETKTYSKGYLDTDSDHLVLLERKQGQLVERVYNLKNMRVRTYAY